MGVASYFPEGAADPEVIRVVALAPVRRVGVNYTS